MRALFFLITGDVFMIQICFEKFDDIGRLVDHGSRHLAEGDLSCSYCGQELSSLAGLAMHQLHQPAPHPDPAPSPGLLQDCAAQGGLVAARAAKLTGLAEQCGQHAALLVGLEMAAAVGEEGTLSAQLASWKHHLQAAAGPEELRPVIARLEAEVCRGVCGAPGEEPLPQDLVLARHPPDRATLTALEAELGWSEQAVQPPHLQAALLRQLQLQLRPQQS